MTDADPATADAETIAAIIRVRDAHPDLAPFGFRLPEQRPALGIDEEMAAARRHSAARARMNGPEFAAEVAAAHAFLLSDAADKTLRRHSTSYGLKHSVEQAVGRYISNGALLTASLAMGLRVERIDRTPNARISMPRPKAAA